MVTYRSAQWKDVPRLHELWREVFGDSDAFLDTYFEKWFDPAAMLVAQDDGRIVSMSTVYRHAALVSGGAGLSDDGSDFGTDHVSADAAGAEANGASDGGADTGADRTHDAGDCPCIFAVATDEIARGQGLAMELIRRQIEAEKRRGTPCMMIAPAEDSLFALYAERFGFEPWFYVNRIFCRPSGGCCGPAGVSGNSADQKALQALTPVDYNERREAFLRGRSHLKFTDRQTELEELICAQSGGGLYEIGREKPLSPASWAISPPRSVSCRPDRSGEEAAEGGRRAFPDALCAIERISDSQIRVNELLVPETRLCDAILQIQAAFPAEEYEIRIPSYVNRFEAVGSMRSYSGMYEWESKVKTAMLLNLRLNSEKNPEPIASDGVYAGFVFD